jgi:PEP-CTERM motif
MFTQKPSTLFRAAAICAGVFLTAIGLHEAASAAVIVNTSGLWPTAPNEVQTIDALSVTHANRGISTTRVDRQSFTVSSDITVDTIFLSANNYNNIAFTISFFQTAAVNGNPLALGSQIGSTITVSPFGSTASGDRNLQISLDPSEQIFFPGLASTAGYVMAIQLADTSGSTAAFNWVHSNTGSDIYTGGRYRRDDGDMTNTRDFGLALVQSVPEPGSLAFFAFGSGILLIARRRKKAA